MSNEAAEGFADAEVEGRRNVGSTNKLLENDVNCNTDKQGCRTVRWLPPGSTRWEESGEEKLKEALLAQAVGKEALLVQGKVREALREVQTRAHKSAEEGDEDQEGRKSGKGNVGIAEEGGVRMQDDVDGRVSKKTPVDIVVPAKLPLKKPKKMEMKSPLGRRKSQWRRMI